MKVVPVPVLDDNFAYLLIDEKTKDAAAIDPAEPKKVIKAAKDAGVNVEMILATHKHRDHSGGNTEFVKSFEDGKVEVVGGSVDRVQACTRFVKEGDVITIGGDDGIQVECLHTPGHTMGHICYYATQGDEKVVFTGDTLFVGGCGKFFEGDGNVMEPSLGKLARLPPETKVYCGHEYTLNNYKFATKVDPDNELLKEAMQWAQAQKSAGEPTIPSTIGKELATNPFLRVREDGSLQRSMQLEEGATNAQYLQKMRDMKDGL